MHRWGQSLRPPRGPSKATGHVGPYMPVRHLSPQVWKRSGGYVFNPSTQDRWDTLWHWGQTEKFSFQVMPWKVKLISFISYFGLYVTYWSSLDSDVQYVQGCYFKAKVRDESDTLILSQRDNCSYRVIAPLITSSCAISVHWSHLVPMKFRPEGRCWNELV